jgi:pheromone shutdown-related protein TraB|tara:strand:+ start:648 stop:1346 length:699 start_codon:yes stop_codon:yes gene_type:complete
MKYKNLTIIGTSHIAQQSLNEVKTAIETEKPEIIALELDKNRLYALMNEKKVKNKFSLSNIKKIGFKGFLFSLIGAWAEKKLGKLVGVSPGSEMKKAVKLARKHQAKIALIDKDIEQTLKRFSETLTWKEKWNFLIDIFKSVFKKKKLEFDLREVPNKKIIKKLIKEVKERYPNVYKVLITERNRTMAANLQKLMENNQDKKILAIIGAGHEEGILKLIKEHRISYSFSISQ